MEYIQDLLRKYGPSLKIKQLSLNFDDAVYRNDGIIGHNDLLFVFMELFDVPGGCFVGTTGFFVSGRGFCISPLQVIHRSILAIKIEHKSKFWQLLWGRYWIQLKWGRLHQKLSSLFF